jgi:preprotein translocase subunit YajC
MHWLTLPGQREVVVVILLLAIVSWIFYFRVSRRVRTRVLG